MVMADNLFLFNVPESFNAADQAGLGSGISVSPMIKRSTSVA